MLTNGTGATGLTEKSLEALMLIGRKMPKALQTSARICRESREHHSTEWILTAMEPTQLKCGE